MLRGSSAEGRRGDTPFALDALAQVAVRVHDVARAEAFDRDLPGMRPLFTRPPRMAFFRDSEGDRMALSSEGPRWALRPTARFRRRWA